MVTISYGFVNRVKWTSTSIKFTQHGAGTSQVLHCLGALHPWSQSRQAILISHVGRGPLLGLRDFLRGWAPNDCGTCGLVILCNSGKSRMNLNPGRMDFRQQGPPARGSACLGRGVGIALLVWDMGGGDHHG
jgi:hypothetical protein